MDTVDIATENYRDKTADNNLAEILASAAKFDPGVEGECDWCGNWSGGLVDGFCAPCRERLSK